MHKIWIIILFIGLGASCSGSKTKTVDVLSPSISLRERLIEKYRLLRLNSEKNVKPRIIVSRPLKKKRSTGKIVIIKPLKKITVSRKKKKKINVNFFEKQKEIEQNIAYYCIKYERKYSTDRECLEFAHSRLIDCEVKAIQNDSMNVVRCLKRQLSLR